MNRSRGAAAAALAQRLFFFSIHLYDSCRSGLCQPPDLYTLMETPSAGAVRLPALLLPYPQQS